MREAILRTLAYFDIFEYPLTAEELYRSLWKKQIFSYRQFLEELKSLAETGYIQEARGLYFLPHKHHTVAVRQNAIRQIDKKLSIARRAARLVRCIPFVRAFFICNTVADGTAKKESDIDVFIVIQEKRLWLARLLITCLLTLFRLRRHGKKVINRICLSFYATHTALDFRPLLLVGGDPYFTYWIHRLIPVFDPHHIYDILLQKNNWTQALLPQAKKTYLPAPRVRVDATQCSKFFQRMGEALWGAAYGDLLERQAKILQIKKMEKTSARRGHNDTTRIVINDTILKFHEEDRREQFRDAWHERLEKLEIRN